MTRTPKPAYELTDAEKRDLIALIQAGKPLPAKYRFVLFEDKRQVELVWNGKTRDVCTTVLPFQSLEHVDEPRKQAPESPQFGLFDTRGRQLKGWTNKLIWGDNKLILSSLKAGALRAQIEDAGGLKLIYIDPPFNVSADFAMDIEIGGETFHKEPNLLEQIAYRDTWGRGAARSGGLMADGKATSARSALLILLGVPMPNSNSSWKTPPASDSATRARMRAVRLHGTQPEHVLRATLRHLGLRYRSNPTHLPGKPDAVVASYKLAIFAHGCFWHRHEGCARTTTPKRNATFWLAKFVANQERDRRKARELKHLGYRSIVMWECELLEVERRNSESGSTRQRLRASLATASTSMAAVRVSGLRL